MPRRLLTAQMADNLLQYLHANFPLMEVVVVEDVKRMLDETGLTFEELHAFLEEFQEMGLIFAVNLRRVAISFGVTRKLDAFLEAGGFSGELAKLKTELQILQNKLENLPREQAKETLITVSTILQIIGGLGLGFINKY